MAYTWRTSKEGVTGTTTTLTVVEPTGIASGDYEFVVIGTASAAQTVTTPSGWTLVAHPTAGASTGVYVFSVTGGRGGSAPGLNFTLSVNTAGAEWHCLAVGGSNLTIDASAFNASVASTGSPDPPSATAVQTTDEAIALVMNFAGNSASLTPPAGYTMRSVNTSGLDWGVASKDLAASGAENPAVFTGWVNTTSDNWAGTILLQAAGAGASRGLFEFPTMTGLGAGGSFFPSPI